MCLQDMLFVSVDAPNLYDMNHDILVLMKSKESS